MNKARPQTGFMLIEVMISVLIFALGVLALVGLQAAMTRAQTDAKVRADASNLAGELVGMMWADASNLAGYNNSACASTPQCAGWKAKVILTLPDAKPDVSADVTTGVVKIKLMWTPPSGTPHQYLTATTVNANPP
ncbi:MAG: pilus assembly protein PilV [Burkholderiales bacterium]|nr:pilus assembly protein PilV [Burkholderiales bacterium]